MLVGDRVGAFEVLSKLGEGGMGEVYRATDTVLKRQVALKVLPPDVANDPERVARFQREAEVLASLNHPNIAHLYGLERSGGTLALVMELVEGPTLADRIANGAIPLDEALPIAKQIAEALEAAHEQGIIHRDLKPANVKGKDDGTVKVLDFGLAKAMERGAGASSAMEVTNSPTITSPALMTGVGMLLGTAAYMSPEQARGRVVDRRVDIWAFGCVLYEMLTGTRAFEDDDVSLTLSRVLQREPDFDALPPSVPPRVVQTIRVCLRKDPKQRTGDIRDVRLALEGAFETGGSPTITLLPGGKALMFVAGDVSRGLDTYTIDVLTLTDGRRKTVARGGQSPHYVPSPDGTGHLVYSNKATLFAIPFDPAALETRGTAVPILDDVAYVTPTGVSNFDVSRTGTLIYRKAQADVVARTTVQWVSPPEGATGKQEPLRVTPGAYTSPRLSPDGNRIALVIADGGNQDIWVYDPQRDNATRLTFGGLNRFPVWSPNGQYVVFTRFGQGLFATPAVGGSQPQPLTETKAMQVPWSFTPDGTHLAFFETLGRSQIWTVALEDAGSQLKAGKPEPFLKSTDSDQAPSFSPDGRWLAYHSNHSGRNEVYVRAFPPPASSSGAAGGWQVSNNGGVLPRWSRTGHDLVYQSGEQLATLTYTGNGTTFIAHKPRVWIAALGGVGPDWDLAPDGKRVAVLIPEAATQAPGQEHEIVMLLNFADELRRRVPLGK
jgi:serine/threonine protein kinase